MKGIRVIHTELFSALFMAEQDCKRLLRRRSYLEKVVQQFDKDNKCSHNPTDVVKMYYGY